jgi:ABC-type ATPase with predicted acetyltransferase domain
LKVYFEVKYNLEPVKATLSTGKVYGYYGMEPEQGERVYVEPFEIDVVPGSIVSFVGTSGSGKTSCLNQFRLQTDALNVSDIVFDVNKSIIDQLVNESNTIESVFNVASLCGLAEAQLLLRTPNELSDGQMYRLLLTSAILSNKKVLIADEFLSNLDRISAKVIAFNIRKLVDRYGLILATASTQDDYLGDLNPNTVIRFDDNKAIVSTEVGHPKVGEFPFTTICTLRKAIALGGQDSLNGITADQI